MVYARGIQHGVGRVRAPGNAARACTNATSPRPSRSCGDPAAEHRCRLGAQAPAGRLADRLTPGIPEQQPFSDCLRPQPWCLSSGTRHVLEVPPPVDLHPSAVSSSTRVDSAPGNAGRATRTASCPESRPMRPSACSRADVEMVRGPSSSTRSSADRTACARATARLSPPDSSDRSFTSSPEIQSRRRASAASRSKRKEASTSVSTRSCARRAKSMACWASNRTRTLAPMVTSPRSGASSPATIFRSVVLPAHWHQARTTLAAAQQQIQPIVDCVGSHTL